MSTQDAAQSQSADAKPSIEVPADLSIPPFLRREQPKPQQPADATKPNGSLPPQHDEQAQDVGFAAPQQCGSPAPPAQNADIAAPYRVSRSMMQGTPEQRRPVTQADLDEINAGLAREGIEPVRQPAPRTPLRSYEQPAGIEQEAEESSKFLDDLFGPDKRHLVAIRRLPRTASLKSRAAILRRTIAPDSRSFVAEHQAAGYDLYFTGNPIKGELHKKASKDDVAEARRLWVDLDPRKDRPLEEERAQMLALGTTNLPGGDSQTERDH